MVDFDLDIEGDLDLDLERDLVVVLDRTLCLVRTLCLERDRERDLELFGTRCLEFVCIVTAMFALRG